MGKDGSVSVKEQTARDGDTLVNTGVVAWPDEDSAWATVRRMQLKLHRWASEDSARRFGDLFNLVYDPAFLIHAWERVRSNDGARTAGIDGLTVAQIETRVGVHAFLGQVRDLLKSGEYRPSPVRRVKIPKGGGKLRSLGIPTVADRVVQAACKAVLEPVFEADFLPCSYGFRPNRRAQDAIAEIHHFTSRPANYHYVLEADIAACLDAWSHCSLADCWGFEQGVLWGWDLDTQAFSASGAGEDGAELAALDLVQNGLAGDAEGSAGVVEGEPAVGGVVDEHAA